MKKIFLSIVAFLFAFQVNAQKEVTLTIKHMLGASPLVFGAASTNNLGQNFNISRVDYYISNIRIIHDGGAITAVPETYILAKGSGNISKVLGTFSVTNVEGVKFNIGVENPTNHNDPSLWPSFHPLAPQSPSMHWGWAGGYRFVAIEGMAGSSLKTEYQMHGLEDLTPLSDGNYFEQTVMAAGVNVDSKVTINLDADYKEALRDIDVASGPINHGDNTNDLTVLKNFRDHVFSPGSGLPTSITSVEKQSRFEIYPNPSKGIINLATNGNTAMSALLFDITGRKLKEYQIKGNSNLEIRIDTKGFYFLKLYEQGNEVAARKLIVE